MIDEHGKQVAGEMIRELQGMDGLFIYYVLFNHQLEYVELRELVEYLIDHDIIQRLLDRKGEDEKRSGCGPGCASSAIDNPQVTWDDAEAQCGEGTSAAADEDRADPQRVLVEGAAPRAARRQEARRRCGRSSRTAACSFLEFVEQARPRARGGQSVLVPRPRDELRAQARRRRRS